MFKDAIGWEDLLQVDREGNVFSKRSNRLMKWCLKIISKRYNKRKDAQISITLGKKQYRPLVSHLVAETFIPNPENKPQVNHKDGNPLNNSVENLEWVTDAENKRHAQDNWLTRRSYNEDQFEIVKEMSLLGYSRKEVAEKAGLTISCVRDIRLDKNNSHPEFKKAWDAYKTSVGRKHIKPRKRIEQCND